MNIYARYFDQDTLVYTVEELIDFLSSIPDIHVTPELINEVQEYVRNGMPYPRRYKVRPRVYFILIKTNAATMEEFKAHRKQNAPQNGPENDMASKKELKNSQLTEKREGWYKASISFKRVIQIPGTVKFQYQDTAFAALVKAGSALESYNKVVGYLKGRNDIDLRSQFPSARGQNYQYNFIGEQLPENFIKKYNLKIK